MLIVQYTLNISYKNFYDMKSIIIILIFFVTSVLHLFSQENIGKNSQEQKLMHKPKYCIYFDNNTMPSCPDVGLNFNVEVFTDRIKQCGVDHLVFHVRCDQGMAYYNTKIGIRHPSLKYDLFGKIAESCQRKDIALTAFFNGGISSEEGLHHREWTTLYFDGREYREPRFTPYVRTMCYNSSYRDHLIEMVKEVAYNYPVSGFFIDCLDGYPCVCPICVKQMKEKGIDYNNEEEVIKFSEYSAKRLAADIAGAVKILNTEYLLFFSGVGYEEQKDIGTYIECVCLPTGGDGYELLPILSHYLRTLDEKPIVNMTSRFYEWGDFGGLRSEAALKFELLYGLANGMRPNVGGHFHPRGDLNNAVFDRIEKIYKKLQILEPWFNDAKNITEIAIVFPKKIGAIRSDIKLKSVVRMLNELYHQFDVVTLFSDWSKYKVLIIPDDITFNDEVAKRIKAHLAAGKAIISSGSSGLDPDQKKFVFEMEWGVKYLGKNSFDPAYFIVGQRFNEGLPNMPLSQYSSGVDLEVLVGTNVEARLIKPYYNQHWDGEYVFYYIPPDRVTDLPAFTVKGNVAHFSYRIFTGYADKASVELKTVFSNVLDSYLPDPLFKSDDLPSFARVFVTEKPERRMVHLISYVPEMRGQTQMIEEPIKLSNFKISLRVDGKKPKEVYSAPEKKLLRYKVENGYINVTVPECNGYSLIVFRH